MRMMNGTNEMSDFSAANKSGAPGKPIANECNWLNTPVECNEPLSSTPDNSLLASIPSGLNEA